MNLTLTNLLNVVIQTNRSHIGSVDSLFRQMTGDQAASDMMVRLVYWSPRAKKRGGWVYKSWRDWLFECGLSQAQIKRVHKTNIIANFGFTRKVMKANGAPTTHYRLDTEKLLREVAKYLNIKYEDILKLAQQFKGKSDVINEDISRDRLVTEAFEYQAVSAYVHENDIIQKLSNNEEDVIPDERPLYPWQRYNPEADAIPLTDPNRNLLIHINDHTNISIKTLQSLDQDRLDHLWRAMCDRIDLIFLRKVQVHTKDLIFDGLRGVDVQVVADEIYRRRHGKVAKGEYSQIYVEQRAIFLPDTELVGWQDIDEAPPN